jgi:hypothetical protein
MDWLQFFSSITNSLAWPTAVVALALLMRNPLAKLIPLIRSLKYKDLQIDIGGQLEAAREQVDAISDTPGSATEEPPSSFKALAQADPRAAILSAWLPVEIELTAIAKKSGAPVFTPMLKQLKELHDKGILDQLLVDTLMNLRRIRNSAVHVTEESVSFDDAINMAEMCQWAIVQLKDINANL